MKQQQQLAEILSWRLVTELYRRSPTRFVLIETHPGGGQYDCLGLYEYENNFKSVLAINRTGSVHVHTGRDPQSWKDWIPMMLEDSLGFVDAVSNAIGIEPPSPLPKSTPTTITLRFICEFMTHTLGRLEGWECRNGFLDSSGFVSGEREDWFLRFPNISNEPPPQRLANGMLTAAYSYWFLLKNQEPVVCLDTDGRLYKSSGEVHDLVTSYAKHKRVWPVIAETALELLP